MPQGLLVVIAGLLVAAALLWVGLPGPSAQNLRLQLAQTLAQAQANELQRDVTQMVAQTAAAARNPQLLTALQSHDAEQIRRAENSLRYLDGVVDAKLSLSGQAELDSNRLAPVNFAALDMIHRTESGHTPAVEALKVADRWLVYSVAPIGSATDTSTSGTLLLAFDLRRLTASLASLPAQAGEMTLQQQFADGPPQTLFQQGMGASSQPMVFAGGTPDWSLTFTPGPQYNAPLPWLPIGLSLLAALAVLASAWLAISRTSRQLHKQIAADVRQLTQLIQELSGGKAVKAFSLSLPELNVLAQSLARLSLRDGHAGAAPAPVQPGIPAAEWADPLFQDTDILDIDILDEDQDFLRTEHHSAMNSQAQVAPKFPDSIFRAYDIRGVVDKDLTTETAYWIGRAIGSQSLASGEPNVSVGRDGRLSGPMLVEQLIRGLADSGCHVSDVGLVPTPALYYAANVLAGKSGVMLTGSHNPPDYNGFKIVIAGDTLANEQIQALHDRLKTNNLSSGKGSIEKIEILDRYFKQIRDDIVLAKRLKVVVDCGNGAAGVIAPQLIEALGCEVIPLFCDVDGNFPNHHPDPGQPENLVDLIAKVKETNADLGLAFDGDGDRVGVVTNKGTIVFPDRLLMLFARDVVSRNPGADIIFDVKCTRRLIPLITSYGGRPVMWKTGHSLIKKQMKATGALLAGEMSGHIFFKERWFGFDDGIYSAARLLEILSQEKNTAEELFDAFPNDISTPEINIHVTDENKFSIIDALQSDAQWGEANLTTIDGVRVDYPKGWGLVRASNTTPVLVLRFEADNQAELERIQEVFRAQLKTVAPDLQLPF
jgi:phosphomannomutase/phosphoglucomutase